MSGKHRRVRTAALVPHWLAAFWQVGLWAIILSASGLLLVMLVIPRVAGATPYTILTGSMAGTYDPGSLVVVKPKQFEAIGIGDPITYQVESGQGTVVTHRVVGATIDQAGERRLITRGDANDVVDAESVREVQVRGAVWYSLPHVGRLNAILSGAQHQVLVWAVAFGLLGYAGFQLGSAVIVRTRRPA